MNALVRKPVLDWGSAIIRQDGLGLFEAQFPHLLNNAVWMQDLWGPFWRCHSTIHFNLLVVLFFFFPWLFNSPSQIIPVLQCINDKEIFYCWFFSPLGENYSSLLLILDSPTSYLIFFPLVFLFGSLLFPLSSGLLITLWMLKNFCNLFRATQHSAQNPSLFTCLKVYSCPCSDIPWAGCSSSFIVCLFPNPFSVTLCW